MTEAPRRRDISVNSAVLFVACGNRALRLVADQHSDGLNHFCPALKTGSLTPLGPPTATGAPVIIPIRPHMR